LKKARIQTAFVVALRDEVLTYSGQAIPRITDDFNSVTDIGWYGSAYLLTFCVFQLLFGKVYTYFSVKAILFTSILVFEVASAICGAAPNSAVFIVERAITGVGAAGIMTGIISLPLISRLIASIVDECLWIVCIVYVVPLRNRPQIQGLFGALFGLIVIAGLLTRGAFTSNVTWR